MRAAVVLVCLLLPALAGADEKSSATSESAGAAANAVVASTAGACRAPLMLEQKQSALQKELDKRLRQKGYAKYLDRKQLGVAVVDLTKKDKPAYAGVNDDVMMYTASLPKISILLSVVEAAAAGQLEWTFEHDKRMQQMIVASDNEDASWGTDIVGLMNIESVMRDPRYCLYDDQVGGLWVGRAYRGGGATNRDPRFGITHGSTARQATRFYALLDTGKLVSPHWSFRMLGLMSPPKHRHKFVRGLDQRPGLTFLARKSGTWRNYHADSALIQHDGVRYAVVAQTEHKKGEAMMEDIAQIVDDLMMDGPHRQKAKRNVARR